MNQEILSHRKKHFIFTTIIERAVWKVDKTLQPMSDSKRKVMTLLFERTEGKKVKL